MYHSALFFWEDNFQIVVMCTSVATCSRNLVRIFVECLLFGVTRLNTICLLRGINLSIVVCTVSTCRICVTVSTCTITTCKPSRHVYLSV